MIINSKFLIVAILFATGVCFISFGQNKASEIEVLAAGADLILTGKVVEQNSSWNEDKTRIYTDVTLTVDEYIKGSSSDYRLVVTHPGGEVGDVGELYTHFPRFYDNEEVLLFVKKDLKDNKYKVFKGEYGKITLLNDKSTGEKMAFQNTKISELKEQIKNSINVK